MGLPRHNPSVSVEEWGYRHLLREVLEARRRRNARYSLRAFARDLDIGANRLSQILNRKQGLSLAYARRLAERLELTPAEKELFCEMVRQEHARSPRERLLAARRVEELRNRRAYGNLAHDTFLTISEWQHLAIVELSKTEGFAPRAAWIAKRLGISETVVKESLHRLERVGRLVRSPEGWRFVEPDAVVPDGVPSEGVKRFHEGVLEKAAKALREQPLDAREYSTLFLAIRREAIEEVRKRIEKFWMEIDRDFGMQSRASEVYCLGVQFFGLSRGEG